MRLKKRILIAGLAFLVLLLGAILFFVWVPRFDPEKYGTVDFDVTYCTMQDSELKMDLYFPDSGGPWPVLVFVHGGGWTEGDKAGVDNRLASGYLLVSINYRLYPDYRFPAMIEDVKCAIRSLRAHAREYNLEPERIALIGHSAGGHLVALAGMADEQAGWDVGEYLEYSSRVQAVVVLAGPVDLSRSFPNWVEELILNVFGSEQQASGSPISYVSPDDPPFFILHGDADPVVPVEQAYLLRDELVAAGVPVELVVMQNGGHGFEPIGAETNPSGDDAFRRAMTFLDRYLSR
jgi:acetyl esterase/lipase